MGIFNKIFGSQQKVAGDEGRSLVPVYLDSIALGAEPKAQVQKIRAIVGDSDTTFNEYLGELEMAGDEKPEVIRKAVDIVTAYYKEHLAGDEKEIEVKKDGDDKNVEVKKDGKETKDIEVKKDGDKKDVTVKEAGDEAKKDDKSAGDGCMGKLSGDELDAIADKVAARMLAAQSKAQTQAKEEPNTAGDEGSELETPLGGDEKSAGMTSDSLFKDIWG